MRSPWVYKEGVDYRIFGAKKLEFGTRFGPNPRFVDSAPFSDTTPQGAFFPNLAKLSYRARRGVDDGVFAEDDFGPLRDAFGRKMVE